MATERVNDARAFREFLDAKLPNGGDGLTLDEYLELWQYENQTEEEREKTLEAIQRGFGDVEAGRVRPAREAIAELRRKHNLPSRMRIGSSPRKLGTS